MNFVIAAPFALQVLIMAFDELYCHSKRDLPKWERWGHPLDTLVTLVPLLIAVTLEPNGATPYIFAILAFFSCLFITKDEFIHAKECDGLENWLHALLFVIHPMVFFSVFFIWMYHQQLLFLLEAYTFLTAGFLLFQLFRWNGRWKK